MLESYHHGEGKEEEAEPQMWLQLLALGHAHGGFFVLQVIVVGGGG